MGMRGPKSTDKARAEWANICMRILLNGHMSPSQAERYFGVGTGTGRMWRYWIDQERLARAGMREQIIGGARADGLLTAADLAVARKLAAGADVTALPPLDVPDVPADVEMRAEEATAELWRWMQHRKLSRFMVAVLRHDGLETDYEARAEMCAQQIDDQQLDETMALAWIRNSYLTRFAQP